MAAIVKNAGWLLQSISASANVRAYGDGVLVPGNPWFRIVHCDGWELAKQFSAGDDFPIDYPPVPDWSLWSPGQSCAEFLNLLDENKTWQSSSGDPDIMGFAFRRASEMGPNVQTIWCVVADWMLPWVSGRMAGVTPLDELMIPPIWPGAELVTMGRIAYLARTWSIEGPLNGIVVMIATGPVGGARYDWGDYVQYPRAGYVTFLSDSGCFEDPQPITFEAHIVCPKLVRSATRVVGRCNAGVSGFAQAWAYATP